MQEPEKTDLSIDEQFAQIALTRNLVTTAQIESCKADQLAAAAKGQPVPRMDQLMIKKGLISTSALVAVVRQIRGDDSDCIECEEPIEEEAGEVCINCATKLEVVDPVKIIEEGATLVQREYRGVFPSHLSGRSHLSRYKLVREIARGGMGVVYEAIDPDLRRRVALKVLKNLEGKEEHIKRLHREAAVAARLSHPNIIPIHEVGATQEAGDQRPVHFIAMGYVEGETLADAVSRLSLAQRMEILCVISQAVGYAHDQGVIHRDLKPENILLTKEDRPIVTDFGLARAIEDNTNLTVSGAVMGTSYYMAPEQVLGRAKEIDARSDVWALGVIMYELLGNRRPFEGKTQAEVYHGILRVDPPPPRGEKVRADKDLETICLKALEKQPGRRYESGQEIAQDIKRWRKGDAIRARPPSFFYRTQKKIKRHPWFVAGLLLTLVLITLSGWWGSSLFTSARHFRDMKKQAQQLVHDGEWTQGLIACQSALAHSDDEELSALAQICKKRLALEKVRRQRLLHRGKAFKKLQDQIQPISRKIEETRPFFNIPNVAIGGKLAEVEKALTELERIARSREYEQWLFPDAWALLGSGYYLVGQMRKAEAALTIAAEPQRGCDDWWVNYYLGRIYLRRALATQSIAGIPSHPIIEKHWKRQALEYLSRPMGRWDGAKAVDKDVADTFRLLAADRLEEVATRCRAGLKKYAGTLAVAEYWHLHGYATQSQERIELWNTAIKRRPNDAWIYFMRGCTHHAMGNVTLAHADYNVALRKDRYLVYAYNNRGVILQGMRRHGEALRDFERAIAHDRLRSTDTAAKSQMISALINLGWQLSVSGRLPEALQKLSRATAVSPGHWQAWWRYGEAAATQPQQKDQALKALRKAKGMAPAAYQRRVDLLLAKLK